MSSQRPRRFEVITRKPNLTGAAAYAHDITLLPTAGERRKALSEVPADVRDQVKEMIVRQWRMFEQGPFRFWWCPEGDFRNAKQAKVS